jgi:serine/threonine protein kinase
VQCDVWSTGVITYILLSSHIPFDGDGESEVFERILSACYSFPSPLWDPVSAKGLSFSTPFWFSFIYFARGLFLYLFSGFMFQVSAVFRFPFSVFHFQFSVFCFHDLTV